MSKIELVKQLQRQSYPDRLQFRPLGTPEQLLRLGIFDGMYFNDDQACSPIDFMLTPRKNLFAANVSQSRQTWIDNGWMCSLDPLGWFQWYVRFHAGRRTFDDSRQIARWSNFNRHVRQIQNGGNGDITRRARQRQACLHWAHNPISDIIEL